MTKKAFVYFSCWDNLGGAPGIGIFGFDRDSGKLEPIGVIREDLSCGFSLLDKKSGILYVCIETEDHPNNFKGGGGRVVAFRPDPQTGELTELSEARTFCPNPCYLSFDATGKYMVVANHSAYNAVTKIVLDANGRYHDELVYDDAVIELFRMNDDGSFGELVDIVRHDKPAKGRPLHSHPQSAVMSPCGSFFVCSDVGDHHIYTYKLDRENEKLVACCETPYKDAPKSKPRYAVFNPTLPIMYINHEGTKEIGVFKYEASGELTPVASVSGVPAEQEYPDGKGQSGLLMHPSGKYLYDIMSANATISVFQVDEKTGIPVLIQNIAGTQSKMRAFGLSPDARFLLTTCLQTGVIEVFRVGDDGRLTLTDQQAVQKGAAFVTFFYA